MKTSTPKPQHKFRDVSLRNRECEELDIHKGFYKITVEKSPRAPEYEVHYVKMKNDKQVLVRKKKKSFLERHREGGSKVSKSTNREDEVTLSENESLIQSDPPLGDSDIGSNMFGLRVIACNKHDGLYYPGYVTHTPESAFAMVTFNNTSKQKVRTQMIIPMSGAIPTPDLRVGDFVLVLVSNQMMNRICYVPGIVEVVPRDFPRNPKFYTILLYNGQRDTSMRRYLVKIGRSRFEMAVKYIAHCQQQRQLRNEAKGSQSNSALSTPRSRSDDVSTDRSDRSDRGRHKKKKKIMQKLADKKDRCRTGSGGSQSQRPQGSGSSRSSRSRSRSGAKSRMNNGRSDSSQSNSSRSRSTYSRSASSSRSSSQSKTRSNSDSRSTSRSHSDTRSRSRSNSRSRLRSRSNASPRSRTENKTARKSKSKLKSRKAKSSKVGRSRSRSPESRSQSSSARSRSSSASTLRTRSWERSPKQRCAHRSNSSRSSSECSRDSSTPRGQSPYNRPETPVPKPRPKSPILPRSESVVGPVTRSDIYSEHTESHPSKDSRHVHVDEKDEMIQQLQAQLEKQKRKQLRQEQRLVRQARKINKISQKLKESDTSYNESRMSNPSDRSAIHLTSDLDKGKHLRQEVSRGLQSAPDVKMNEEVLARWTDDGWFYRGRVSSEDSGGRYRVIDATGYMEDIERSDILSDGQQLFGVVQPQDCVIGLHPKYTYSYAPGEVLSLHGNGHIEVEFYDGNIDSVPWGDVYKISKAKYEETVDYIKWKEKQLVGKSVVARDDSIGIYKLGIVDSRVGLGQQYYVKWLDGDMSKQNTHHIFEVGLRQNKHDTCLYVLAPTDHRHKTFLPAKVISQSPLHLELCDGRKPSSSEIRLDACFWLSKQYYENAVSYLRSKAA